MICTTSHNRLAIAILALGVATVGFSAQLVAQLAPGTNASAVSRVAMLPLKDVTIGGPFALYNVPPSEPVHMAMARLAAVPGVLWVEDDMTVDNPEGRSGSRGSTIGVIGDRNALYTRNTGLLNQIGFSRTLAISVGRNVRIAILDTGLSPLQTALWSRVSSSANYVEVGARAYDLPMNANTNGNAYVDEGYGHGTFVAGLVDQVAPRCPLVIARVADSDGVSSSWRITKGIVLATLSGCEVANISLGSLTRIPALSHIVDWAENEKGLLIVAPAGNDRTRTVNFPAAYGKAVAVAGVDSANKKAIFSNWDGSVIGSAPATGLFSSWPDGTMGTWSGTSFASPLVAGSIADALRRRGKAFPGDLQRAVNTSGMNLDSLNPSYAGKLGTLLRVTSLDAAIRSLPIRP